MPSAGGSHDKTCHCGTLSYMPMQRTVPPVPRTSASRPDFVMPGMAELCHGLENKRKFCPWPAFTSLMPGESILGARFRHKSLPPRMDPKTRSRLPHSQSLRRMYPDREKKKRVRSLNEPTKITPKMATKKAAIRTYKYLSALANQHRASSIKYTMQLNRIRLKAKNLLTQMQGPNLQCRQN